MNRTNRIIMYIFILLFVFSLIFYFIGCERLILVFFDDLPISADYDSMERYSDGGFVYTKYYYDKNNIENYRDRSSQYYTVSTDTLYYITNAIKCFEYNYNKDCTNYPDGHTGTINQCYDFCLETDLHEGDFFFYELNTAVLYLSSVIPENQFYDDLRIVYVSFEKNIVYCFEVFQDIYMFQDMSDEYKECSAFCKDKSGLQKAFNQSREYVSSYGGYCSLDEQTYSLNYYYELKNSSFVMNGILIENKSIDALYAPNNDYFGYQGGIAYIRSDFCDWSEEDFFLHYAKFFGNKKETFFEYDGTQYMKIKCRYFTYYFFVYEGDYIIEFWDVSNGWEPSIKQLSVVRVAC